MLTFLWGKWSQGPTYTRVQIPVLGSPCPVTTALSRGGQPALLPHTLILRKKHNRFFPYNFLEKSVAPPTLVLLPGKSHGQRNLIGYGPWGHSESDTTERLHFHFPLSCIGEGNGSPLQCPCLENPRDRGAWWASVYGVAQSRTQLKRLSSSREGLQKEGGVYQLYRTGRS